VTLLEKFTQPALRYKVRALQGPAFVFYDYVMGSPFRPGMRFQSASIKEARLLLISGKLKMTVQTG